MYDNCYDTSFLIHGQSSSGGNRLPCNPATTLLGQEGDNLGHVVDGTEPILHGRLDFLRRDDGGRNVGHHGRLRRSRVHGVDSGTRRAEFGGPAPRQAFNGRLGGTVYREAWQAGTRSHRADVDNVAGCADMREYGLSHEERAAHIQVVDRSKLLRRDFSENFHKFTAGAIDQNVYPTGRATVGLGNVRGECGKGCSDYILWRFDVAKVFSNPDCCRAIS